MNLALEKTEEHVDGVKRRSYGDAFVRGNNGMIWQSSEEIKESDTNDPKSIVMYISAD